MLMIFTFLFLQIINFVAHYLMNSVDKRIAKKESPLSHFSLFFKDIPRGQDESTIHKAMEEQRINVEIREMFFLRRTSEC